MTIYLYTANDYIIYKYNNINVFVILFPQPISKLSLRSTRKTTQKLKSSAPKKEKDLYGPGLWVRGTHPHPFSLISTRIANVPKVSPRRPRKNKK